MPKSRATTDYREHIKRLGMERSARNAANRAFAKIQGLRGLPASECDITPQILAAEGQGAIPGAVAIPCHSPESNAPLSAGGIAHLAQTASVD